MRSSASRNTLAGGNWDRPAQISLFLRDDIEIDGLPALTAREAFRPHANWLGRGFSEAQQLEIMQTMPYEEV